jgi:hypothetical protein
MRSEFTPKLFTLWKAGIPKEQLRKDFFAGIIVGIVALPLAIAFAIASGLSPDKGLITAVVAGFTISALGGSRVQIGGPTGAFIVIVYGIVQKHGVDGLTIATLMAGVLMVAMGLLRFGNLLKFFPHTLVLGFTSGIAVIILSSQVKDFFGLDMGAVPSDFIEKWTAFFQHFGGVNATALAIGAGSVLISVYWGKITRVLPGPMVAILLSTAAVALFHLPVSTIEDHFGAIPRTLPSPEFHTVSMSTLRELVQPALAIALLGGIESLLSAVVADGMIGGQHRSNMELVAQGGGQRALGHVRRHTGHRRHRAHGHQREERRPQPRGRHGACHHPAGDHAGGGAAGGTHPHGLPGRRASDGGLEHERGTRLHHRIQNQPLRPSGVANHVPAHRGLRPGDRHRGGHGAGRLPVHEAHERHHGSEAQP